MRLVIDASAGLYVATSARGFGGLEGHDLVAPPLFWSESVSALHQISWRGGLSRRAVTHALEAILLAPIDRVSPPDLARRAWDLADRLGWAKTYDAEYVALAHALGLPLLTRDARLGRVAARIVEVVAPADL